jgi:hypothetical protein
LSWRRGGTDYPQVAAAADLDALAYRFGDLVVGTRVALVPGGRLARTGMRNSAGAVRAASLADYVREGLQVVGTLLRRVRRQAHHVPAARHDEPGGVLLAQVITVRLNICGKRPEHRRGVAVHVRERVDGRLLARST